MFITSAKWTETMQIVGVKGEAIWTHLLNVGLRIRNTVSGDIILSHIVITIVSYLFYKRHKSLESDLGRGIQGSWLITSQ